jgi:hypothetical protein
MALLREDQPAKAAATGARMVRHVAKVAQVRAGAVIAAPAAKKARRRVTSQAHQRTKRKTPTALSDLSC